MCVNTYWGLKTTHGATGLVTFWRIGTLTNAQATINNILKYLVKWVIRYLIPVAVFKPFYYCFTIVVFITSWYQQTPMPMVSKYVPECSSMFLHTFACTGCAAQVEQWVAPSPHNTSSGLEPASQLRPFWVQFAGSHQACTGFPWVLWFLPSLNRDNIKWCPVLCKSEFA